jgi:OMF family outer membrane factor
VRRSRTRNHVAGSIFFLALAVGPPARSETTHALTFDQAIAMARRANRSLVAERAHLAQAQTNLELAWSVLFPTVAAQGKYTRNNMEFKFPLSSGSSTTPAGPPQFLTIQPKNQLDGAINFTAPLLVPAAYPGLDAVKAGVRSSEAEYETSEAMVLYAVAQAFYAAAISDEVMAARQSSIEVAQATLDNAQTRFAAGTVTKVDVDRAELALVRAEQAAREARFGHDQAYRALATLVQTEGAFQVAPLTPTKVGPDAQDLEMALHLRPEFRALGLAARSFTAYQRAHAWRWAPSLAAFGSARVFNYDNFAQQHHAWAVGAQLDWVLFDSGTRDAQRHLAEAQAREAYARAEVLRDSIRDDLANTHGLLETKRHAQAAAERQVVLALETLDLVRTQYEAGNSAQLDLLQAQDGLTAAKEALAQAHFEVAVADLSLRRAAGTFPGKY